MNMQEKVKEQVVAALEYRSPMRITELYIGRSGNGYYVCPRCKITLERDFAAYCDRCGQCLSWSQRKKAKRRQNSPDI